MKDFMELIRKQRSQRIPPPDDFLKARIVDMLNGFGRTNPTVANVLNASTLQAFSVLEMLEMLISMLVQQNNELFELYTKALYTQDKQIIITTEDKIQTLLLNLNKGNRE